MEGSNISLPWPFGVGGIISGGSQIITPSFNWAEWVVSPNVHKTWSLSVKVGNGLTVSSTWKQNLTSVKYLKEISQDPVSFMAREFQLLFFFWPAAIFWLVSQKMVVLFNFYFFPPANLFFLHLYQFFPAESMMDWYKHTLSCQRIRSEQKCLYRHIQTLLFLSSASSLATVNRVVNT